MSETNPRTESANGREPAHSLHAYFLKTGEPAAPIGYQVERLRDGRYYATRAVRAVQNDRTLMFNALRPHGTAFVSHRAASLDHALWFHRDGRGMNCGRIFDGQGRLLASVAQEAMQRRT